MDRILVHDAITERIRTLQEARHRDPQEAYRLQREIAVMNQLCRRARTRR